MHDGAAASETHLTLVRVRTRMPKLLRCRKWPAALNRRSFWAGSINSTTAAAFACVSRAAATCRQSYVVCATALVESAERLLGIGATQLDRDPNPLPDLLIVERRYRDELGQLLTRALIGAAHASSRSRAA